MGRGSTFTFWLMEQLRKKSEISVNPMLELKLPDSVQACKLLHGACLQTSERQMVLATTKTLKLSEIRGTLKRIFCDTLAQTAADVKEKHIFKTLDAKNSDEKSSSAEAFYGRNQKYRPSFSRKRFQDHYAQRGGFNHGKKFKSEGKNPKDNQGYVTTCRI